MIRFRLPPATRPPAVAAAGAAHWHSHGTLFPRTGLTRPVTLPEA